MHFLFTSFILQCASYFIKFVFLILFLFTYYSSWDMMHSPALFILSFFFLICFWWWHITHSYTYLLNLLIYISSSCTIATIVIQGKTLSSPLKVMFFVRPRGCWKFSRVKSVIICTSHICFHLWSWDSLSRFQEPNRAYGGWLQPTQDSGIWDETTLV